MPPTEPETASIPLRLILEAAERSVPMLRWRGSDDVTITTAMAPGDVVIVPAGTPSLAPTPTDDVAEEAAELLQQPRVRLLGTDLIEWRESGGDMPEALQAVVARLKPCDVLPYPGGVVVARRRATSERSTSPVGLRQHSEAVAALAEECALGCHLSPALADEVKSAALWHDAGKADRRMQLRLGCNGEPLAKSGQTFVQMRAGLAASGYPRGQRHELLSVELARQAGLSDLALHLIAAHHGHARPFVPTQDATQLEVTVELDGKVARANAGHVGDGLESLFWRLQEAHGPWALALLTAILVDADRRTSAS
jgi:CRISPR-associated helicase Cas3